MTAATYQPLCFQGQRWPDSLGPACSTRGAAVAAASGPRTEWWNVPDSWTWPEEMHIVKATG